MATIEASLPPPLKAIGKIMPREYRSALDDAVPPRGGLSAGIARYRRPCLDSRAIGQPGFITRPIDFAESKPSAFGLITSPSLWHVAIRLQRGAAARMSK